MKNFVFHVPTKFVFGKGVENDAGKLVKEFGGMKVLIHYGGGSAVKSGLIGRIEKSLEEAGLSYVKLGGVKPNPRDTLVYEGIELVKKEKVDFILSVGGGSAIDSGKTIAHGSCYEGDFWDFFCGKAKIEKTMPFGVVLTMSAAGSESSNSCVITQESTLTKRGSRSELNRPLFAIMNPELAMTLPPYQIASGATDILAHIMERYFTCEPEVDLTDRMAEG
ncbi:MAG: iron-containing alcohol dehydrogenase, partial [Clostridia bacterium]|nr:iron-containing alcohol dehydrogenase [Clostridia bacterium]